MASRPAARVLRFDGLREESVLGTFDVIRGYASIFDLAAASAPRPYAGDWRRGEGYQREISEEHVAALVRFLSQGRYRFFPEIILGLQTSVADGTGASIRERRAGSRVWSVQIDTQRRGEDDYPVHRIDGNHRLEAASRISQEERGRVLPFDTVPFCIVVLDEPSTADITEAMLFNLINSKALPIVSEHSLAVLMQDEGTAAERFDEDRQLFLTRAVRDVVASWPSSFHKAMGPTPLTRLHHTAAVMLRADLAAGTPGELQTAVGDLFEPLSVLAARLSSSVLAFVASPSFLPVAAEVYLRHTVGDGEDPGPNEHDRLSRAERWLREYATWYLSIGGPELPVSDDPTLYWRVFKADFERRSGEIFVAMSFAEEKYLKETTQAIDEAIVAFNSRHSDSPLRVGRADRQKGAAFQIPAWVFEEISKSRLLLADLTDEKPNVYLEVGYAISKGIPVMLTFHRRTGTPPWDRMDENGNKVAFDIAAFRYVAYDSAMELRDQLILELDAFFAAPMPPSTTPPNSVSLPPVTSATRERLDEDAPVPGLRPAARSAGRGRSKSRPASSTDSGGAAIP
jgi:nucleoside 2-deoxyribosyltransferase